MTVFLSFTRHVVVFALFCLVVTCPLYAQMRVGQGGAPDGSAAIDINGGPYKTGSPYRGILPPKVSLVQSDQATPVQNPAVGLLVYNTAKGNDVVPGYYYWDGSKWARLSTASTGSARVAAVTAGTPVPEYTVAQVRSFTTAPSSYTDAAPPIFMLVEEGKEGLFRYSPELTYADPTKKDLYAEDDGVMILVTAGRSSRGDRTTYRRVYDSEINVRWFGAKGDGTTDDSKAIQAAIDYARSKNKLPGQYPLFAGGGGLYRTTVLIPEGNYLINKTLDVTNANGLVIKGVGGRYINTTLVGNSKGAIIDFTGSIMSGCENLTFSSNPAYPDASTVGVLFALGPNGNGGLNCTIDNCFFQLLDNPSANNGIGTIGIINCRSEEFSVTSCLIKANLGIILTNQSSLAAVGYNYTIQSAYTTIATGTGSMGVVNFSGQNSIQNYGIRQPALILNGTNAVNFHGYIGRASGSGADTTAAIVCSSQQTFNVSVNATVESFSQLLRLRGAFENCTINATVANQVDASKPVIDATNAKIEGCKIQVSFGNVSERYNRYLVYHAPVGVGSGTLPAAGLIRNSEIISTHLLDNNLAVSANLLRNSDNVTFHTEFPFEKKGGIIRQLFTHPVSAGTVGSNASATVLRIRPADVGTDGNTPNAGYYQIFIRGVVTAGYNATGGYAACPFTATITMSQAQNRGKAPIMTNVVMQGQSTISPSYESINAISVNLDVSDPNVYKVLVTPSVTGSGSAENLTVDATVEVKSNFSVNDVIIYP